MVAAGGGVNVAREDFEADGPKAVEPRSELEGALSVVGYVQWRG